MSQITIYLDDWTEKKMRLMAESRHMSKSRWVAELIKRNLSEQWPDNVCEIPGSWKDAPFAEELRASLGEDLARGKL